MTTLRIVLAVATKEDMTLSKAYVESAFLIKDIDRPTYTTCDYRRTVHTKHHNIQRDVLRDPAWKNSHEWRQAVDFASRLFLFLRHERLRLLSLEAADKYTYAERHGFCQSLASSTTKKIIISSTYNPMMRCLSLL